MTSSTVSCAPAGSAARYACQSKFGVDACSAATRHLVVGGVAIAVARAVPLLLGERRLERERCARRRPRDRADCASAKSLRDVGRVRLADRDELLVGPQVVVAVGHAEPRLRDLHGVLFGVALVRRRRSPRRAAARRSRAARANAAGKSLRVADRRDRRQLAVERRDAERLDARLVHEALVEVADLLADRAGRRPWLGLGFDDRRTASWGARAGSRTCRTATGRPESACCRPTCRSRSGRNRPAAGPTGPCPRCRCRARPERRLRGGRQRQLRTRVEATSKWRARVMAAMLLPPGHEYANVSRRPVSFF